MIAHTATEPDRIIDLTRPAEPEGGEAGAQHGGPPAAQESWRSHARCNDGNGRLAGMFFSEELQDIARAKHICATCPALIPCLEGALERREPWGVWGGQLFLNGRILATKRRRGRPPKRPRPEDQVPDIPIPEHLQARATARIA
jgi:WhiB family redox-sensing transcriptional regulator